MNYYKNALLNSYLDNFYATFSHTLDTSDFVPEKFNLDIRKKLFAYMKDGFSLIDKVSKEHDWKIAYDVNVELEKFYEPKKWFMFDFIRRHIRRRRAFKRLQLDVYAEVESRLCRGLVPPVTLSRPVEPEEANEEQSLTNSSAEGDIIAQAQGDK